jgi:hypothetical protein
LWLSERSVNAIDQHFWTLFHFIRSDADESEAFLFKQSLPHAIIPFTAIVKTSVDLNCQPMLKAVEVDEEPGNAVLPPKLQPQTSTTS